MAQRRNASKFAPTAPRLPGTPRSRIDVHLLAAAAAILCAALAWLSRHALNPDGVSYLDLAALAGRGDWAHFVQGYWSPLMPVLLAAIGKTTGLSGARLVAPAHWLNLAAALGAIAILWRWSLRAAADNFGRVAIPALLLCSAGMPRIEAVTPDVLLLLVITWTGYELIGRSGERWLVVGLLLGAAFLTKTSCWPWLALTLPVRWWAAPDRAARRRVALSTVTAVAIMATWIVPLSLAAGGPTVGSAGRLSYSWYIDASTSRLPDTDRGNHRAYRAATTVGGQPIVFANLDDANAWTYLPWGDPTAWAAGALSDTGRPPTAAELISYWLRQAGYVFGFWLLPLILAVLLPVYLLHRRPGMWRELATTQRDAAAAIALGLGGVLQFVAVHAEPRLIAPFAMMLAMGVIAWCLAGGQAASPRLPLAARHVLGWGAVATLAAFGGSKMAEAVRADAHLAPAIANLDAIRTRLDAEGLATIPIGVIGPAAPVLAAAFWIGARITIQIPPRSARLLATLPDDQQNRLLASVFGGRVELIWRSSADGNVRMMLVPAR